MNATERWMQLFADNLECVKCRSKENLTVYDFHGRPLDPLTQYEKIDVSKVDVWCSNCVPRIGMRVLSGGRLDHKMQASEIANIRMRSVADTTFDKYVLFNSTLLSKQELETKYKSAFPCECCNLSKHHLLMVFHRKDGRPLLIERGSTLSDYIESIKLCVLVCVECHIFINNDLKPLPDRLCQIDDQLLSSFTNSEPSQ